VNRAADLLRTQAEACAELGSPLYAGLLSAVADDVIEGGPAADVLAGHDDDPEGWAIGLRLMGAVHRLVLERRAPALATHFPSVGGTRRPMRSAGPRPSSVGCSTSRPNSGCRSGWWRSVPVPG